jgi:hypothetical protein
VFDQLFVSLLPVALKQLHKFNADELAGAMHRALLADPFSEADRLKLYSVVRAFCRKLPPEA